MKKAKEKKSVKVPLVIDGDLLLELKEISQLTVHPINVIVEVLIAFAVKTLRDKNK